MNEAPSEFIDIQQLQIGMFIELELGWMSHPFPKGSFKISSEKQIEVIRGLGLKRIRYVPGKSDIALGSPVAEVLESTAAGSSETGEAEAERAQAEAEELRLRKQRSDLLSAQQRDMAVCERRFGEAIRQYKLTVEQLNSKPRAAMEQCLGMVNTFVGELLGDGESVIRLLSDGMGDKASMHPVNVTIVSLLLGKSLGLPLSDMVDLGMAAFLHDIGKTQLPDRVRWLEENFSSAEYKLYQEHVGQGVTLGRRMELTAGALQAIAQHHELIDGSGFPAHLKGDSLSMPAKILALVNRYENLCNPGRPTAAITPHEALSLIFAQLKTRFDSVALSAFIRMMGVYPPGSIVQLVDERFALVVSVNSSRPLKPRVLVHEPCVSKHEALILDLEYEPTIGIRRSLKSASLPKAALEYLAPRQRICYFFEKLSDLPPDEVTP
ncbi:HD-GYP domain-containing protein [Rhodoferax sp. UBA5149]|uniref:HD-GYP domain-containing protein n=1 Tax=Rhodoferax sp. UBA5149 TaxID=1947379 RepID=UPI0025F2C5FF|nr:HD-GYP domain-containing protein [Rhodoferax sp. UBA5149]